MQKNNCQEIDLGVSEFDEALGALWSDHCIHPVTSFEVVNGDIILLNRKGEYRGKASLDILLSMGEQC